MKVLVLAPRSRYETYSPELLSRPDLDLVFCDRNGREEDWLAAGADAEALFVTPVTWVRQELLDRMPKLRLIHSEGVGFDRIDLEAARRRGIYVCNNAGCNAPAVAELTITLMSMLLHRTLWGDRMVKSGLQNEAVKDLEVHIPTDLSVSTVGLVGFGAIGKALARRLQAYGSQVVYYARHRQPEEVERDYGVTYLPLQELAARCDILSLHLPATAESRHLVDEGLLRALKPGAYLVNTSRGALIDDQALCAALRSGHLTAAALDCYDPEPAGLDHPLVQLGRELPDRLILCPHQGGISTSAFRRAHQVLQENLEAVLAGARPINIVNGL